MDTDDLVLAGAVVSAALDAGTTLFDSSPMYGKAERTLGAVLEGRRSRALVATKVWTDDDAVAERQIAASLSFYGGRIELLQIHNMVPWPERLRRIEELRDSRQVTLVGATHWQAASFDELEAAMVTDLAPLEPFGIHTRGQALLQWGLSHPASTVAIPATSRPTRATENAAAGDARPLDDEHRQLISRLAGA